MDNITIWQLLWFLVLCASMVMYTILDGFDLGVGILHLFGRTDNDRRVFLNSIGPVWDGNEVWLVVIMGGLFAGFPVAYASLFSGFYDLFMILIAVIIFRAVAIEFRSKKPGKAWRMIWDFAFSFASIIFAFTIGLTLGNLIQGVPLNASFEYSVTLSKLLNPYAILVGLTAIALLAMHGTIFLFMKTEGELHSRLRNWINTSIIIFVIMYLILTVITIRHLPFMIKPMYEYPVLFIFPLIAFFSIAMVLYFVKKEKDGRAFIFSCAAITFLLITSFFGVFPNIIRSTINPTEFSLTIFNSSSTDFTLKLLFTIAMIGVPLVLAYGVWIYHIFRGKVKITDTSY
jgi:cytochrome bd ubiquinol oxidase subunit II